MKQGRDQRELSDVARRHGDRLSRLVLNAAPGVLPYRAVAPSGELTVALAGAAGAIGVSLPFKTPGSVTVALPGDVVEFEGWNWTPGMTPVDYQHGTGLLVQGGGAGHSRLGYALGRRVLLIEPA